MINNQLVIIVKNFYLIVIKKIKLINIKRNINNTKLGYLNKE
jgi:hypothetical protein